MGFRTCLLGLLPALFLAGLDSPAGTEIPIPDVLSRVVAFDPSPEIDSYAEFLDSLPVTEGEDRGYDRDGQPRPGLLATRAAIHASLSTALLASGGTVFFEDFAIRGVAGRNVVGLLPGQGPEPTRHYLIGAHYDSVQNPGADDNGSGVAGVLLAARALAPFRFEATLAFALFDLEEQRDCGWGLGSRAHAAAARRQRVDLRGVVVLDMIAHDHEGAGRAVVSRSGHRRRGGSADLAADLLAIVAANTRVAARAETGDDGSDHFRFARRGFPAVLLIEDLDEALLPRNPYWHTRHDFYRDGAGQLQEWDGRPYIDVAYATDLVRAVVAWATDAAGLLGTR